MTQAAGARLRKITRSVSLHRTFSKFARAAACVIALGGYERAIRTREKMHHRGDLIVVPVRRMGMRCVM